MRGDRSISECLSIEQTATVLDTSSQHIAMLLDRNRIAYETTATGQRRILRSEVDAYRRRQQHAYAAIRDSMLIAESLADDAYEPGQAQVHA